MVIKKLNSLFHKHSRVVFGIFTIIIIIAFMDFLTPGRTGGCSGSGNEKIGTAFGKKVTVSDLQEVARKIGSQNRNMDTRQIFNIYCLLHHAEQSGITVSEQEVADAVKQLFSKNGKFDEKSYDDYLKKNNLKDSDFFASCKMQLTIDKLARTVMDGVGVTDGEIEAFYKIAYPRFAIRVLEVKAEAFAKEIKDGSPADLEKYFKANEKKYVVPGNFTALIVDLPFENLKNEAAKSIKDSEVEKIIADIRRQNAEKKSVVPADAELKKFVREQMTMAKAGELAQKKVNEFARFVYDEMAKCKTPAEKIAVFRKIASDKALTVIESGKVDFNSQMIGKLAVPPEMVAELQRMPLTSVPVTHVYQSGDGVCVGCLVSRTEQRQQKFAEVAAKVQQDYRHAEAVKAARKSVQADAARIAKAKDKSAEFSKCRGKISNLTFSLVTPPNKPEQLKLLQYAAQDIQALCTGEYSKVIDTPDGALIVEVTKRSSADMEGFERYKPQIRYTLLSQKRIQAMDDLRQAIMSQCHYDAEDQRQAK